MKRSLPPKGGLGQYEYERGEGRYKHRWDRDEAGFVPGNKGPVGKCHSSITKNVAEHLLHTGIVEQDPFQFEGIGRREVEDEYPLEVYNIYRGVPYVAVPTRPGKSYHGYPWRGRMSATVRRLLEDRATQNGTWRVFKKWVKAYSEN